MATDWAGCADAQVWAATVAGDPSAAAEIFDRHADRVYTHCARLLTSRSDAEDAASIVFFEAWRKGPNVRFVDGSLLPWLLVTGTNTARNLLRGQRRYRTRLQQFPASPVVDDFADDVADAVDAADKRRLLATAMAGLSRDAHQVVSLCDLSGLSYAEAAEALRVPVGTVRSRLSRARSDLRRLLGDLSDNRLTSRGGHQA